MEKIGIRHVLEGVAISAVLVAVVAVSLVIFSDDLPRALAPIVAAFALAMTWVCIRVKRASPGR